MPRLTDFGAHQALCASASTPPRLNSGRTHPSAAIAFPGHTDYAYAGTHYRRRMSVDGWVALAAVLLCGAGFGYLWLHDIGLL